MHPSQALLTLLALACALALGACAAPNSAPPMPADAPANTKAILTDEAPGATEADEEAADGAPEPEDREQGGAAPPPPDILGAGKRDMSGAKKPQEDGERKAEDKPAPEKAKNRRSGGSVKVTPAANDDPGAPSDPKGLLEPIIHRGQDQDQDKTQ